MKSKIELTKELLNYPECSDLNEVSLEHTEHTEDVDNYLQHQEEEDLKQALLDAEHSLDPTSDEFRKQTFKNRIQRRVLDHENDDPLTTALLEAQHLTQGTKTRYVEQAVLFLQDMQINIFRNQFQLNEEFPDYTADEWNDFLQDRIVSVYINKHKRTLLRTAAEDSLADPFAKNKRDNLNLINSIKEEEQKEAQKNIVIIRIPDIYD